jgi:hypothetical protein
MPHQEILSDIPESDLDRVVKDFESEGATVTKKKQPDGNWTVTATFPDGKYPSRQRQP